MIRSVLSPVTAVLALNVYNQRRLLGEYFLPVIVGCLVGTLTSVGSVLLLCKVMSVDSAMTSALLPKSVTTAIAIAISENLGGIPGVTAAAVVLISSVPIPAPPVAAAARSGSSPPVRPPRSAVARSRASEGDGAAVGAWALEARV